MDFGKRAKKLYVKIKNSKLSYLAKTDKKMQKVNEGQHHECICIGIKILICIHINILTNLENNINAYIQFGCITSLQNSRRTDFSS